MQKKRKTLCEGTVLSAAWYHVLVGFWANRTDSKCTGTVGMGFFLSIFWSVATQRHKGVLQSKHVYHAATYLVVYSKSRQLAPRRGSAIG